MRYRSGASSRPVLTWAWGCVLNIISVGCTLIDRMEDEMCGPPFIGCREFFVGRWDYVCGLGKCVVCFSSGFRSGRANNFGLDGWRWVLTVRLTELLDESIVEASIAQRTNRKNKIIDDGVYRSDPRRWAWVGLHEIWRGSMWLDAEVSMLHVEINQGVGVNKLSSNAWVLHPM